MKSRNYIALCIAALSCLLSACYDDTFKAYYNTEEPSPFINFKITDDFSGAETLSRGVNDPCPGIIRNIYPLVSEEGGDTLYLIESEISGAYPDTSTSTQQSRGEKINNSDGLVDALGLYCFNSPGEEEGGKPAPDTELKFDQWKLKKDDSGSPYFHLYNPNVVDSLRDGKELWPGHPLDFVAYYPYQAAFKYSGSSYNNADPKDADYKDELYGWVWSPDRTKLSMHPVPRNEMYLYYKVPESIDKQVDFMAAYIHNQKEGTCEIKLNHLLTAIRFETGEKLAPCSLKKIIISGVRENGYMDVSKLLNDDRGEWWGKPEEGKAGTESGTDTETESGTETRTESGTDSENEFIKYLDLKKGSSKLATYTISYGDDGREFKADPDNPNGYTKAGKSLLGDESQADNKNMAFFLMPQDLEESANLYIELEYKDQTITDNHIEKKYTIKKNIDLKPRGEERRWLPGTTILYTLSGDKPDLVADLYLTDENNMPLKEISVGYAGGETNYKVGSYVYLNNKGAITKYPMPWKASIVEVDENGNETPIIWYDFTYARHGAVQKANKDSTLTLYNKQFGSFERIEFDYYYKKGLPATLAEMEDNPVKTFVMVPKIEMKTTSSATAALRSAYAPAGNSKDNPFNLASRGIGLAENGLEIFHKNGMDEDESGNAWTNYLAREYTYTKDDPSGNDINTANCYIVSAPGWYTIPLVYGNAVKDGCVNYSAYVFKSSHHGDSKSSTSDAIKDDYGNVENLILQYAIRHDGKRIYSPYILDPVGTVIIKKDGKEEIERARVLPDDYSPIKAEDVEAKLLWEDQVFLIDDVSLVDDPGTQVLDEFYSVPTSLRTVQQTYTPQKKIRFQIKKEKIRQGNAVIVLKEKDTTDENGDVKKGDVIWSWHIWVTPDGTGTASNYHPISHKSTIYGRLYPAPEGLITRPEDRISWTEKHNHYIYNRCIGMVMAGDELKFTAPKNVYIKYEPMYEAMVNLLSEIVGIYGKPKGYGYELMSKEDAENHVNKMKEYFKKNPVYVKVNQADLSCKVEEDYYMLYQWGRKDPMISRFENVYDGDHKLIVPTDKRYMGQHHEITDHKEWIMYGIKHPEECMFNGGIAGGNFYANLWNFSLGTDEINSLYPAYSDQTDFFRGDAWAGAKCILYDFYFPSDRVFKSVYDPCPVGQKIPVGPVINFLSTATNNVTQDAGDDGTWYYYTFAPFTGYGHTASGMGGLFTECRKGPDGKYIPQPDYSSPHSFWIPAFGYRYGNGITKQHGNEFAIWEGGALNKEGNGRVLFGDPTHVTVIGKGRSRYSIYFSMPVLPIFEEPHWLRTF